jgi:hypothetical protein
MRILYCRSILVFFREKYCYQCLQDRDKKDFGEIEFEERFTSLN